MWTRTAQKPADQKEKRLRLQYCTPPGRDESRERDARLYDGVCAIARGHGVCVTNNHHASTDLPCGLYLCASSPSWPAATPLRPFRPRKTYHATHVCTLKRAPLAYCTDPARRARPRSNKATRRAPPHSHIRIHRAPSTRMPTPTAHARPPPRATPPRAAPRCSAEGPLSRSGRRRR